MILEFDNPITGGQGTLVRPQIKSPDYIPGVSGWIIRADGTAEFNNVTVRGEVLVTDPDGSYVHIFNEDPGDGAVVEMRLPDSAGAVIVPARLRSGTSPEFADPALELRGPDVDGHGSAALYLVTGPTRGAVVELLSEYAWFNTGQGCTWVVSGDWELAHEIAPNIYQIHFQVWADGTVVCGPLFAGGPVASEIDGDLNLIGVLDLSDEVTIGAEAGFPITPIQVSDAAFVSTASAAFVPLGPGAGTPSTVFRAPPSGAVRIPIAAAMTPAAAGAAHSLAAIEVREGNVIGAGAVVHAASDNDRIDANCPTNTTALTSSNEIWVTGLTPYALYNVRMMYRRPSGAVNAGFAVRRLKVDPMLISP
jgi:hypothetical protein